jgi:hypothetical protein
VRAFVYHFGGHGRFGREGERIVLGLGVLLVHSEGLETFEEIEMEILDIINGFEVW